MPRTIAVRSRFKARLMESLASLLQLRLFFEMGSILTQINVHKNVRVNIFTIRP
jgi:hypothetical protein